MHQWLALLIGILGCHRRRRRALTKLGASSRKKLQVSDRRRKISDSKIIIKSIKDFHFKK